jgi:hypothetical protein
MKALAFLKLIFPLLGDLLDGTLLKKSDMEKMGPAGKVVYFLVQIQLPLWSIVLLLISYQVFSGELVLPPDLFAVYTALLVTVFGAIAGPKTGKAFAAALSERRGRNLQGTQSEGQKKRKPNGRR